ncbi:acetyltransferase (GNAT) family protein [Marinobacter pelagius]|uniref:Acetyltransferase (GNAT) family protein n=1 Tax=Marinobacter pelagius TaxID=379482 RepID=A0A366GHB5_9GAMM|nr:GNAT family N-acetyltransferase [Marinobacter pelagius]RBP25696.1 acetyltransferase (GNAT) family protein [Marinobacter pelagius]
MNLFLTRAWQDAWWKHWGSTPGFELVSEGRDCSGLYLDHYRYKAVLPVTCLQFIGTNYRRLSTPRTEYNRLPAASPGEIFSVGWSEAVLSDMAEDSPGVRTLLDLAGQHRCLVRRIGEDVAYSIRAKGLFSDYLAGLGRGTRLRLFNRRSVLEQLGSVTIENWWPEKPVSFFEWLNEFHRERWGHPCFNETSLSFHQEFLKNIEHEGGRPDLSVLCVSGKPVSVLYNVLYGNVAYNLQAGFMEGFHKKLALGTLHLGYSIEAAFENRDVGAFDLLAGGGKNEDYKAKLATDRTPLVSLMLVRSPFFKLLYRIKDSR